MNLESKKWKWASTGRFPLSVSKSNIPLLDITFISVLSLFGMLLLFTAFTDIYCYLKKIYYILDCKKSVLK